MKLTIEKADILDVLGKVQGITGRKTNFAITTCILLQANGSRVSISATDLETGFEGSYPATVEEGGILAMHARKFFEIVKEFPNDTIMISADEKRLIEIKNQQIEFHLMGMNPDEFPEIPEVGDTPFFEIEACSFKRMIEQTLTIGAAADEKRAHILGVYAQVLENETGKCFRMASTDINRLAKVDCLYPQETDLPVGMSWLIPKKGLQEIGKFMDMEGPVRIGIQDNNFIVQNENETIIVRLLEGEFPQFDGILSFTDHHLVKLDRKLFQMMLRRMSILSSEQYKGVFFTFSADNLEIKASNPEMGESREDMAIAYEGDTIKIAFNPRYLLDALHGIESDTVILGIKNAEHPCLVKGDEDNLFLCVIMPMKI